MVAPHEREVNIILKLVRDASVTSESRNVSEIIKKVQSEANQATTETTRATTTAVRQTSRATENATKQQQVMMGHMASMGTQFTSLITSSARLARGIGLVFISGEKDREKFIEALVKIIGYTDILAGGVSTIAHAARMWVTYSRAVQGAATAHTALAAAQGGSLAAGGTAAATAAMYAPRPTVTSSLGGGVKRSMYVPLGAAAGAAGGSRVAAAFGSLGTGGTAAALGALTIAALGAAQGLEAIGRWVRDEPGPGPIAQKTGGAWHWMLRNVSLRGKTEKELRELVAASDTTGEARAVAQEILSEKALARLERKGARATIEAEYQAKRGTLEAQQLGLRINQPQTIAGIMPWVDKAKAQGQEQYLAALGQAEAIGKRILVTSKAETAETQRRLALLQRTVGLGQTAIERWVGMDPRERARFLRAKGKLERGEGLGRRDFEALQGMRDVGTAIDPKVIEAYVEKAKRLPGTVEALGADYLSRFAVAREGQKILKVQIEAENRVLTISYRDLDDLLQKLDRLFKERDKILNQKFEDKITELVTEEAVQLGALH